MAIRYLSCTDEHIVIIYGLLIDFVRKTQLLFFYRAVQCLVSSLRHFVWLETNQDKIRFLYSHSSDSRRFFYYLHFGCYAL